MRSLWVGSKKNHGSLGNLMLRQYTLLIIIKNYLANNSKIYLMLFFVRFNFKIVRYNNTCYVHNDFRRGCMHVFGG